MDAAYSRECNPKGREADDSILKNQQADRAIRNGRCLIYQCISWSSQEPSYGATKRHRAIVDLKLSLMSDHFGARVIFRLFAEPSLPTLI